MKKIIKEISASEIKEYISRHNACHGGTAWTIQPKVGALVLNFKKYSPNFIDVNVRRKNGNGLCVFSSGSTNIDFKIASQKYQKMTFPVDKNGVVEFKRTKRSIGEIEIFGITLLVEEESEKLNWNNILKKCETTGVALTGNKLLAAEGATIKAQKINSLVTEPPNVFFISDNRAVFHASGEIITLDVDGQYLEPKTFKHFEVEPNVLRPEKTDEPPQVTYSQIQIKQKKPHNEDSGINRIVFDSSVTGFQKYTTKGNVEINKDYIILDFNAEYIIPLKFIYPDSNYIIIVEALTTSGNGKITMTLDNAINDNNAAFILGNRKKNIDKKIRVSSNIDGANLIIGRSPAGKGKILISKILLVLDIDKTIRVPQKFYNINCDIKYTHLSSDEDNVILKNSLSFSRHISYHDFQHKINFSRGVSIKTFCGMSWFSKIRPLFSDLKIDYNSNLLITSINNISGIYSNLFVEEFGDIKIDNNLKQKLNLAKKIFVNSDRAFDLFSNETDVSNIVKTHKPWPYSVPKKINHINEDFILVFNRNNQVTDKIVKALDGFGRVVVVGARGRYPAYVSPVNEYLPYNNLFWLLENAKCILDIPLINDYKSGLLELINALEAPLVTSNWDYQDKPNTMFLNSTETFKEYKIPAEQIIKDNVREMISGNVCKKQLTEDYNIKVFEDFIKVINA